MNADKKNPWNDQATQQLVRYEALFKLLDEIRSLEDIREIARHTSRQWKYFANVTCWHAILFFDKSNTIIDSSRGEVAVNESAVISDWDEYYHSQRFRLFVRMVDHLERYGGEEFILVMYPSNEEQVLATAESLRNIIAAHPFPTGTNGDVYIEVTISLGTATLHEAKSAEELVKNADKALYLSKENGRNQSTQF